MNGKLRQRAKLVGLVTLLLVLFGGMSLANGAVLLGTVLLVSGVLFLCVASRVLMVHSPGETDPRDRTP